MRWSRPRRRATIGIAAGLAALAATAALALTRNGGAGSTPLPLAALSTLGYLRPIAAVGASGPEGLPIPEGRALARTRLLTTGEQIDDIACQAGEQVLFHIHAHLTIFVRGVARQVPEGIGIAPPYKVEATPWGALVAGASCFMWLHTHSAAGIIYGSVFTANPRQIPLLAHAQIQLEVGRPLVAPEKITFPGGL
jgi:hypothetical protein